MPEWLVSIAGPDYAAAVLWTLAALVVLVIVLVIFRLIRGMTFGTFVVGGRNRRTRLAVMDAAAVDSHRRLVLVRRDDVEHLILIGGPTDVVVEHNIRMGQTRRPPPPAELPRGPAQKSPQRPPSAQQRAPQPATPTRPQQPSSAAAAVPRQAEPARSAPPAPSQRTAAPQTPEATGLPKAASTGLYQPSHQRAEAAPRDEGEAEMDRALVSQLSESLGKPQAAGSTSGAASLDDEMDRLLGEISSRKG